MTYQHQKITEVADVLSKRFEKLGNKQEILKANELRTLYAEIPTLSPDERAGFGQEINALKQQLQAMIDEATDISEEQAPIDITAPFDINVATSNQPQFLRAELGGRHPLMVELDEILEIFYRMGFEAVESRQIDDDYHMFGSLNFPEGHPARDDYDTFMTEEGFIAPAHTSTMQNRILREHKDQLEQGKPIAAVVPGRVFRNEDLDARHEHTF